jgi:hypothetical protein
MGEEMNRKPNNVVPLREETTAALTHARVVSVSGREAEIALRAEIHPARIAFSCLVRPRTDDHVLVGSDDHGDYYVLAVVDRPGEQDLALAFPANAVVTAEEGSVNIVSNEAITLASSRGINLVSDQAVLKGREAIIVYDNITATADQVQAGFNTVRLIGHLCATMFHQAIQRFSTYVRSTEDADQVKAGQITRKSDGLYSLDSRQTIMVSKKETKIDGERIFMG